MLPPGGLSGCGRHAEPGPAMHKPETMDQILVIEDFLDHQTIQKLKYFADGEIGIINKEDVKSPDGALEVKKSKGLVSERIYTNKISETANAICENVFGTVIPQYYGARIEWYETPHIIRYRAGGKYVPHSDADELKDNQSGWSRIMERDFSAIIYFNEGFEGGQLFFPNQDYRITPRPGMLVCFPSDHRFIHTAEPVLSGIRYAFVTWAAAVGTERIFDKPRGEIVYLNSD